MKKQIFSILAIAAMAGLFYACRDDDKTYESPAKITITSADLVFTPNGGTNTVTTNAQGTLTATTTSTWLTTEVEGSTLKLTATPNSKLETRTAVINLSANGAVATLTAQQRGMIIDLTVDDNYLFTATDNAGSLIVDNSNVTFESVVSADWIHLTKTADGYTVNVDDNPAEDMRSGSVTLKFNDFVRQFRVTQWGTTFPFASLNTAIYTDGDGVEQTKAVTVEADASKEGAYLIKGLLEEGDIQLLTNTGVKNEYFIPAGYTPGKITEGGSTLTLRCLMSAYSVSTGNRYYPTTVSTSATTAFRMAFRWNADSNNQVFLEYFRNENLSTAYNTDGVIVCKFSTASGASAVARKGIAYYLTNLRLTIQ